MRRCPTGGIVDFGGCWRSRNSIHIYHIYIYIYVYIYVVVGLWLNPLAAPSLNSKIRSALFGSLGTQKSKVSSKEQVAIAVAFGGPSKF
jgi:hypothetical protein